MAERRPRWPRRLGLGVLGLIALLGITYLLLPTGPRDPMEHAATKGLVRELASGTRDGVVAGTPQAAEVMREVLDDGGNAADAAVAGLLAINVTFGEAASFPGVAPLLHVDGDSGEVSSYIGAGTAPAAATLRAMRERFDDVVDDMDIWAQLLPASPDALLALLDDHGTRSFAELAAPAIELARDGFPVHDVMAHNLDFSLVERIGFQVLLPDNAQVFTRGEWWRPIHLGDRFTRPALADTLELLADAEEQALADGGDREAGLAAVRDAFYVGDVAERIVALHRDQDGPFTAADLDGYAGGWEEPIGTEVLGQQVLTNGTWSQGITVPMMLTVLEASGRLDGLRFGSVEHVHLVAQVTELVMADREAYVADGDHVDVPVERLLSTEHAAARADALTDRAFEGPPPPEGRAPAPLVAATAQPAGPLAGPLPLARTDTSHLAVADEDGQLVTITPSDFPLTPMVPDTGLNLGNRMTQFRLDEAHPNVVAPGKRPRITPHAVAVLHDDGARTLLGTPGGDVQAQTNVQVLLNLLVFGMDPQEAVEAPRFRTGNFPSSFAPHEVEPSTLELEAPLYDTLAGDLAELGYTVERAERWDHVFGGVGLVRWHPDGTVDVAADPHENTTALVR